MACRSSSMTDVATAKGHATRPTLGVVADQILLTRPCPSISTMVVRLVRTRPVDVVGADEDDEQPRAGIGGGGARLRHRVRPTRTLCGVGGPGSTKRTLSSFCSTPSSRSSKSSGGRSRTIWPFAIGWTSARTYLTPVRNVDCWAGGRGAALRNQDAAARHRRRRTAAQLAPPHATFAHRLSPSTRPPSRRPTARSGTPSVTFYVVPPGRSSFRGRSRPPSGAGATSPTPPSPRSRLSPKPLERRTICRRGQAAEPHRRSSALARDFDLQPLLPSNRRSATVTNVVPLRPR